jgi:hypothetical protein
MSGEYEGWASVITILCTKKSLNQTDRYAGVTSWVINQRLVLYFSGLFLLTAPLRRRRMSMCISLSTICSFPLEEISLNFTRKFRELFEAATQTQAYCRLTLWSIRTFDRLRLLSIDKPALSSECGPHHTTVLNFSTNIWSWASEGFTTMTDSTVSVS